MKYLQLITFSFTLFFTFPAVFAQGKISFSKEDIQVILNSGPGTSGAGKPIVGDGGGGWRSGSDGVQYNGSYPETYWTKMSAEKTSGSVIKNGLLPPIKPLLELHLRDAVICLGGDGNYYLTGSSGNNIWAWAEGVELWKSPDLKNWNYLGVVWSIEKEGDWEKQWQNLHGKPARALWAPEIHFIKNNYFICLSMPPGGVSILKSATGKAEGPYIHATTVTDKPFVNGIDPTLFEDDDGSIYFTWSGAGRIAKMKDDMSDIAEPFHNIILQNPDHDSAHHSEKCMKRGSNDLGHEGAILFKANGKYYLGAADEYEGRYSSCVAMADNIYGPYTSRHESVPCGGGGNFFKDKGGNWWGTFFGNDNQSPWREKPGIVKIEFNKDGKIIVSQNKGLPAVNENANTLQGDIRVHDPVMIKQNGVYYIYSTGKGISIKTSTDKIHWKNAGRVFDSTALPAWFKNDIPNQDGSLWAPDIHYSNGKYHLYYSVSAWMNFNSSIGYATNTTLDSKDAAYKWMDEGQVIGYKNGGEGVNVIDPNIFIDKDTKKWLLYGSYKAGLRLVELDVETGKLKKAPPERITITTALGEGAFIIKGPEYYYLFASRGRCCAGVNSTYQVVMGRSKKVTGPYLNKIGESWLDNYYSIFLAGDSTEPGRGHNGFFTEGDSTFIVYHAYTVSANGASLLNIKPMYMDEDGWPTLDATKKLFKRDAFK